MKSENTACAGLFVRFADVPLAFLFEKWKAGNEYSKVVLIHRFSASHMQEEVRSHLLFLQDGFIEKLNKKSAHPPLASENPPGALHDRQDLRDIHCFEQPRSVSQRIETRSSEGTSSPY